MKFPIFQALAVLSISATSAHAWNAQGHMIVAAVAWQELSPASKQRVAKLLKLNPSYAFWTEGVPKSERAHIAFVRAATWPDMIKGDHAYQNDRISQSGPAASQNVGYSDHLQHRYWHFVDLPISSDGTPVENPESPNASTQIEAFALALKSHASKGVKSYDLAWLEHLVGDVHQPLHATSRFSADAPHGDRGGNSVNLCFEANCRWELHGLWDGALGDEDDAQRAITTAATLPSVSNDLAAISDDRIWLQESLTIAKNSVYVAPVMGGLGPYTITPQYADAMRSIARGRVVLAGRRLAALINSNLR